MKKVIIAAFSVGAMVLAGCTKTEVTSISDSAYIGFDNAYIGNPTKAVTEINKDNIQKFYVFGGTQAESDLFENVEVAKVANGWDYLNHKEWEPTTEYKFAAYYNDASLTNPGNVSFDYTSGALTFTNFESSPNHQVDLLYDELTYTSKAEGVANEKMQFNFRHLLSIVKFTFKSGFGDGVTVTVSDMDFYGMNAKGTATPTDADVVWTSNTPITEGNGFKLFGEANGTNSAVAAETAYDNCIVMPQTFNDNQTMVAKFTVTLTGEGLDDVTTTKEITAYLPADTWVPGFRYNYVATISGQTMDYIEFDAPLVSDWDDEDDINMVTGGNDGEIVVQQ